MKAPVNPNAGSSDFEQAPTGMHVARCIHVIDLGTHEEEYLGEKKKRRKVRINWELGGQLMTEGDYKGRPFIIGTTKTFSMFKNANLRKMLDPWAGTTKDGKKWSDEQAEAFDFAKLLGANALLTISKSDSGKVFVDNVSKRPDQMEAFAAVNEQYLFSLEPGEFDSAVFEKLSKYWKEQVQSSIEFALVAGKLAPPPVSDNAHRSTDDDIPF